MKDDRNFQERMARIETLLKTLEKSSDPATRAAVKDLVQSVMELHEAAITRMMEIVHESGAAGAGIIDRLGRDPLTSSLLILYGLHPEDTASRVVRAIEQLAPAFRKHGAEVELLAVEDGMVRLRITGAFSTAAGRTLKSSIEEQIYSFAPDVIRIEGLASLGSDLVGIETVSAQGTQSAIGAGIGKGGT